eukprot:TRINITY_DN117840_c0_g1_i1.p1 TRINITY_DN117840_c0_g1~~TRINITY_DN117840_c0_g1_i1.p1  ORF type:complete len:202 (-),score=52.39 TRINITY_DN117840_c0_g1_i1:124-729(-)
MPVICIGPVCIPWTCIPAIIFFLWKFAKPLFPQAVADAIEARAKQVSDFMAPYLEKVPGFRKKKKSGEAAANGAAAAADVIFGSVGAIQSPEHLDELLERSKREGFAVVLDFTAAWCKPCQAIKPKFKAMAAEYKTHYFAEVDADEMDDVVTNCGVLGLPTFQVYKDGKEVGSVTGGEENKLVQLVSEHLAIANGNSKKAQ